MDEDVALDDTRGNNPFNYSPAEIQKALIALIGFLGFGAVYMFKTGWDPALVPALETLVPTGFAVYAVFVSTKASQQDVVKAVTGFISAGVGVWRFFANVDTTTVEVLGVMVGYAATFYFVWRRGNQTAT